MRTLKIALLATAATAALSSATLAADLVIDEPSYEAPVASYGIDGPYAGVYVLGKTNPNSIGAGVVLGANFVQDTFLFGIEGDLAVTNTTEILGQVVAKAGFMAGDSAAIYGLAGFGFSNANGTYIPLGIGAEFAVADNLSLKAQAEYHWGAPAVVGKVGLNWHF